MFLLPRFPCDENAFMRFRRRARIGLQQSNNQLNALKILILNFDCYFSD